MSWVLLGWLVTALVLWGLGAGFCRVLRLPGSIRGDGFTVFWLGWALLLVLLQSWHLFLPVDGRASLLVALLGGGGALWNGRKLLASVRRLVRGHRLFIGGFLLAAAGMANLALEAPRNGDTGAYFLATVRWLSEQPIVPGLGNLFDRLAFNQTYFLYAAVLQVGPFAHRAHALANSLLLLMLLGRSLWGVSWLLRAPPQARAWPLFATLFLPSVVERILGGNYTSLSPDIAIYCLGYVAGELLLRLWLSAGRAPRTERAWVGCMAFFSAVGLTVKLSWAGLGLSAYLLALGVGRARAGERRVFVRTALVHMVSLGLGVFGPWVLRGIILTGYPAYPSAFGGVPVDWRIPRATVENLVDYIQAWGRRPGVPVHEVLSNQEWLGPWARSLLLLNGEVLFPVVLWLASMLVLPWRRPGSSVLLLLPPLVGLLFWFLGSPDPRFAGACFWLLAVNGWVLALLSKEPRSRSPLELTLVLVVFATGSLFLSATAPGWNTGGFMPLPPPDTKPYRTDWGLELQVGRCWDAPPPCSEIANRHLRWREEGNPSRGFKVETHPSAPPSERAETYRVYR